MNRKSNIAGMDIPPLFAKRCVVGVVIASLCGCASISVDQLVTPVNQDTAAFTYGRLDLARTVEQKSVSEQSVAQFLKLPLGQNEAVQLALLNSPALQIILAQSWADAAHASQSWRGAHPLFTLERMRIGDELELGRLFTLGLFDLLSAPQRYGMAQKQVEQVRLRLTADVVEQVTQVRQAWVRAVAAQQMSTYVKQVLESAEASAELARRLQGAGNFTKLDRARQHAFYLDAQTQWILGQQSAASSRAALVRALGLTQAQSKVLILPDRLSNIPEIPRDLIEVTQMAQAQRLDLKMAQSLFESAAKAQGLNGLARLADVELGVRHDTVFDNATGTSSVRRGVELNIPLSVLDFGTTGRDVMNAHTLVAANKLESVLRTTDADVQGAYAAYKTAYALAKHYQDEVIPLYQLISEENLLRYNGMFTSVFELLADSRDQINRVMAALAADQQFWLADAALQAALIGVPMNSGMELPMMGNEKGGNDARH